MSCAGRGILLRQIDRLFGEGTFSGLADSQLLERYLTTGDENAFEALVDRHGPMVLGLCRRVLRDPRDIEDAFQATFLVLVRTGPAIRDRSLVSTWLYRVAYRVARHARTDTLRRRNCEIQLAGIEASQDADTAAMREIGPLLDQELNRLPEKYRAPLVLCYFHDRTHEQAAEALRCPVGTVRSRLARGRELLKKRLTRRGYAPTAAILGPGSTVPARLLTETVPPSLVSATLKLAFGPGTVPTSQAGAAAVSALALAQGALTTMKLAQLKWGVLALCAAGLTVAGTAVVSLASARTSPAADAKVGMPGLANPGPFTGSQTQPLARRFLKGWGQPIDPDGDCSIELANGRLTIKVPAKGHGLEAEANRFNAPRVLRDIEGDFIAELEVQATFDPGPVSTSPRGYPFVGAGLLLWSDEGNYIRLERAAVVRNEPVLNPAGGASFRNVQPIHYLLFEERKDRGLVPPLGGFSAPDGRTLLRLERRGDQVTASASADGSEWHTLPPRTVHLPAKLKLGVAVISSSGDPFTTTLTNFRVLRPE
jgi:RNA polymerase sigma factor (sigma-70 family)